MTANLKIESMLIHPGNRGIETKNNMDKINTTLEIPEGSKAVISGKVIDGKNYLVVEVENEEQKEPEWTKFKRGDVLICPDVKKEIFVIFGEYRNDHSRRYFNCIFNSTGDANTNWASSPFRKTTKEEEGRFFKWLDEEKGLEWDGEKLVEFLREGDMAIFWDYTSCEAIIAVYRGFLDGSYVDHLAMYWDNAIKWDGTQGQYEKVLRGEL
jgi:hypothetical protein